MEEVAEFIGCDGATIGRVDEQFNENNTPSKRQRPARPSNVTKDKLLILEAYITKDRRTRRLSYRELAFECPELGMSEAQVIEACRVLEFKSCVPRRKEKMTKKQMEYRLVFCIGWRRWGTTKWSMIIMTDEVSISTDAKSYNERVLRREGEEYHHDCIREHQHQGRVSAMFWAALCGTSASPIYQVASSTKINSLHYVKSVLEPLLHPFFKKMREQLGKGVLIMEDNAPGHKKHAISYRLYHHLPTLPWPPNSPDLNWTEQLWLDLKIQFGKLVLRCNMSGTGMR